MTQDDGIEIIKYHNFCVVATNEAWPGVYFVHDRHTGAQRLITLNEAWALGFSKHQSKTIPAPESDQ